MHLRNDKQSRKEASLQTLALLLKSVKLKVDVGTTVACIKGRQGIPGQRNFFEQIQILSHPQMNTKTNNN